MNLTDLLLKNNFEMREMTNEESSRLKMVLLEMLNDIQTVCQKNNLAVMLGGGSCLGAVRHNGYIPWDDDLDLIMPRKDYDIFPDLLKNEFGHKYRCVGPYVSDHAEYAFLKIEKIGTELKTVYELKNEHPAIAIDVFPIDNVPENRARRLVHGIRMNLLMYIAVCVKLYTKKDSPVIEILRSDRNGRRFLRKRLIIGKFFSFFSYSKWYKKCDSCSKKIKNTSTTCVSIPTGRGHYFGEMQERVVFTPPVKHTFETLGSNIPNNYDKYLSSLYGDYMQIPPPEKREKHFIVDIDFGE